QKGENNNVLLGQDGFLAVRGFTAYGGIDYYNKDLVSAHFPAVKKLQETLEDKGKDFAIIIPPRTIEVASSKFDYPENSAEQLLSFIKEGFKGVDYIDIQPLLKEKLDNGAYVYYKTDHHYTSLGAYYVYREVMREFGLEDSTIPPEDFDIELASDSFYGTTWSKGGFKVVSPDSMQFWHYKYGDENDYTTKNYAKSFGGFYDRSFLKKKDKYSAFIGGNSSLTTITKTSGENAGNRPRLLLVKDSFGLSLAPFLALHFDLEIVNTEGTTNISEMAEEKECDYVLIVYNTDNFVSTRDLSLVR
ncbi:MAG: DHHW family protein, partial [Eubacteriales bacterium]|nr:DHHW family protein [Eubacteriales bacterium]